MGSNMRILAYNKYRRYKFLFIISILLASSINNTGLRIALDIPMSLRRNFSKVRNYIVHGYRAQHLFGISHLVKNMLKRENTQRAKNKKAFIDKNFSIQEHKNLYLVLGYIDEPSDKKQIAEIKECLSNAVKEYKQKQVEPEFNVKVAPVAYFTSKRTGELEIVQNVYVNSGYSEIFQLMELLKKHCAKYKIKLAKLNFGIHVNYAKIKSKDQNFIAFVKKEEPILRHLQSVRPPVGADKGFVPENKVLLYDGPKQLASYEL